jgi:hypothetical protein
MIRNRVYVCRLSKGGFLEILLAQLTNDNSSLSSTSNRFLSAKSTHHAATPDSVVTLETIQFYLVLHSLSILSST